jgi:hypothetical protein
MTTVVPSDYCRRWAILVVLTAACAACVPSAVQQAEVSQAAAAPSAVAGPPGRPPARQTANEQTPPPIPPVPGKAEQELARGIASYEDGAYKNAALQCQTALDLGLAARADQATAHKYLAFMVCVSGREKACREEFRRALAADPGFDLAAAEISHPVWGPVFRSVKAEATTKTKTQ